MSIINSSHVHSGSAMTMNMGMGGVVPTLPYMQGIFWAFVGTTIGVAALSNIINRIICYQRINNSRMNPTSAKPSSLFFQAQATLSAIIREYSNYSLPLSIRGRQFYLPTVGSITLIFGYLILIVVCSLYKYDTKDLLQWEDIGYRAGYIAICQVPLIILLAGKRSIIGFLTGVGYERLNWLHRCVARSLLFSVLLHVFFWFEEWDMYGYAATKIQGDPITQKGLIAGGILLWIVISSAAPICGLSYEIFLVQHIISWLAFIVALWMHVPDENQIWIYLPPAFWGFDPFVRLFYLLYNNISLFHKNKSGLLSRKAILTPLDESHIRITISDPAISWTAGQHVFLSVPLLTPFTSHPFTIASIPSDNAMEFIIRAKKGATKILPSHSSNSSISPKTVLIDGPYSQIRPLRQFDTVLFIAGSTGSTFTITLLRDLVQTRSQSSSTSSSPSTIKYKLRLSLPNRAVTRRIHFVWVLKNPTSTSWFAAQLENAVLTVNDLRKRGMEIDLEISIYITSSSSSSSPIPILTNNLPETDAESIISLEKRSNNHAVFLSGAIGGDIEAGIRKLSGRPEIEELLRREAEQAMGEMAVVVCGPAGMVNGTRNAAVMISNERGVHKGTRAQGIYVHAEGFGY